MISTTLIILKESLFIKNYNSKVEFCKNNSIKYFFFIVPDKSYVCKEFLPFNIKIIKRNHDLIKNLIPDFSENLDPECYWNTDSHINYLGGKKLSYEILNYIDKDVTEEKFNLLIANQMNIKFACKTFSTCDLYRPSKLVIF